MSPAGSPPMTPTRRPPLSPSNGPGPGDLPAPGTSVRLDQLRFWLGFHDYARHHVQRISPKPPKAQQWMHMSIGRSKFSVNAIANSRSGITGEPELRAEFQAHGPGASAAYEILRLDRTRIEQEFGGELEWHSVDKHFKCRIFVRRAIAWQDPDRHQQCFAWLVENLDRLHRIFHDRVRRLP